MCQSALWSRGCFASGHQALHLANYERAQTQELRDFRLICMRLRCGWCGSGVQRSLPCPADSLELPRARPDDCCQKPKHASMQQCSQEYQQTNSSPWDFGCVACSSGVPAHDRPRAAQVHDSWSTGEQRECDTLPAVNGLTGYYTTGV